MRSIDATVVSLPVAPRSAGPLFIINDDHKYFLVQQQKDLGAAERKKKHDSESNTVIFLPGDDRNPFNDS